MGVRSITMVFERILAEMNAYRIERVSNVFHRRG